MPYVIDFQVYSTKYVEATLIPDTSAASIVDTFVELVSHHPQTNEKEPPQPTFDQHHNNTILMLCYPTYKNWRLGEHKQLFLWYNTLYNFRRTLSIWRGASVLSFLHLLETFCYKCKKGNRRVDDNVSNA
uniref:Uncharacterized protein n=1 Tax=Romanomermis culicivorax TaxID=13658 RepID=A0A915L5G3_ROMCU